MNRTMTTKRTSEEPKSRQTAERTCQERRRNAHAVFADPVGYLRRLGLEAELVEAELVEAELVEANPGSMLPAA